MNHPIDTAKDLFQLEEGITYLNCANMSPMLKAVREAGIQALHTWLRPGISDRLIGLRKRKYCGNWRVLYFKQRPAIWLLYLLRVMAWDICMYHLIGRKRATPWNIPGLQSVVVKILRH